MATKIPRLILLWEYLKKRVCVYKSRSLILFKAEKHQVPTCHAVLDTALVHLTYDFLFQGRCVFSSGSPFPPFVYKGHTFYPGQGNNAYIFPGVALGVILGRIFHIKEEIFLLAAKAIADKVTDADIKRGSLYPPLSSIRECSIDIATKILQYSYDNGMYRIIDCF